MPRLTQVRNGHETRKLVDKVWSVRKNPNFKILRLLSLE